MHTVCKTSYVLALCEYCSDVSQYTLQLGGDLSRVVLFCRQCRLFYGQSKFRKVSVWFFFIFRRRFVSVQRRKRVSTFHSDDIFSRAQFEVVVLLM